jgi:F0F1-type ATP synthase membrane subunit b/b'
MKPDPTIDAIREVRHQISESVNHDARKLVEHYRKLQERHLERILSRSVEKPDVEIKNAA